VKQFLRLCKNHIVGPVGPALQCHALNADGTPDTPINDLIEKEFKRWSKKGVCEVSGKLNFVQSLDLIVETVARDGEAIVRKVRGFPNRHNFAIQHINPDLLDINHNEPNSGIIMGVEINEWGKPVAYHILKEKPHQYYSSGWSGERERIPAEDIIHIFLTEYPNQIRGVPWSHTSMRRLHNVEGMEESELVASRVAAAKMGFFERNEAGEGYEGEVEQGELITDAEPGTFEELPYGVKLATFDPQHPNSQFPGFIKSNLRGAASGLGVSYNSLASDLEGVNYSSIRQGVLEERDNWMKLQEWLFATVCDDIYADWLQMSMLSGVIPVPPERSWKFKDITWQGRRWQWVDPLKDISAAQLAINEKLKSRAEVIRETGREPEDVWREVEAESKMEVLKMMGGVPSIQIEEDDKND
jgi:lambda family phage portal protein